MEGQRELDREINAFVGAVRESSPVHANATDGIWSIALCEAAHRSIEWSTGFDERL